MQTSGPRRESDDEANRSGREDQPRWSMNTLSDRGAFQGGMRTSFHRGAGPSFRSWRGRGRGYFGTRGARSPVPIVPTRPRPPTPPGQGSMEHGDVSDSRTLMETSIRNGFHRDFSMHPSTERWRPARPQPVAPGRVSSDALAFPKNSVQLSHRQGELVPQGTGSLRKTSETARSRATQAESILLPGGSHSKFSGEASSASGLVIPSEKAAITAHSIDANDNFSNSASRISFKPKIVINSERLQRQQRSPPPVKPDMFSPPSKRRKGNLLEPNIVEGVAKKELHDEDEAILMTSADDGGDGVLFEPMNDVCRRTPGKSETEIKASRRLWRKELAKSLLVQGKIIEKVIYRGDGMAIHWRQGCHASSSVAGPSDCNHSSSRQAPEAERDGDRTGKDDPACLVKREASAEPGFGGVQPHTNHVTLPRSRSPMLEQVPGYDDSPLNMHSSNSYDVLSTLRPSSILGCDTTNNSGLATMRLCLESSVQDFVQSRNDIIGLAERTAHRLISLPSHLISVSKRGDIEFTTREAPRSPIPEWEILASPENKFCRADRWKGEDPTFVYFAYGSPLHQIACLGMEPSEEGNQSPKLSYFHVNPHYPAEVDCLCALPTSPLGTRFITSGSDGRCFYWNSDSPQNDPRVEELNTSHTPPLNDLVFYSETSSLYLCENNGTLRKFDLNSTTNVTTLSLEATVRHLHTHSAHVILLETDDPDLGFEIYDLRAPRSSCRFGYNKRRHPSFDARGDLQDGLYARGDAMGTVRLWDLRNVDDHFSCSIARGQQVPHVLFDSIERDRLRLVSCLADNRLSFSTLIAPS